ncbi:MAG TPA: amidohydrolase family protein [Dehalococcoidia bacterium]|nr:amidohydrolase family protein [Dehalococcoidia bacterium]
MITDVHAHYLPPEYVKRLAALSERPPRIPPGAGQLQETVKRLEMMDAADVIRQVLSPMQGPYLEDASKGAEAAKVLNDCYAELVTKHPHRFAGFVSLPLPHVDPSLKEMARGLDELGMAGVAMNCSVFDRSTAEEEFEPLYEEMNRRGTTVFYHPVQNGICSPMITDYGFTVSVGASLEDSAIVLHHIARKTLSRYPNIKMIVPHLGGIIPMLLARLDNQAPQQHPDLTEKPSVTARRFYYDTVGHGSLAALHCAVEAFGAEHLVTGSDYPVLLSFESYKQTFDYINGSGLSSVDIERILHRNAAGVLGFADDQ